MGETEVKHHHHQQATPRPDSQHLHPPSRCATNAVCRANVRRLGMLLGGANPAVSFGANPIKVLRYTHLLL